MVKSFSIQITKVIMCASLVGFCGNANSTIPEDDGTQAKKSISRNHSYPSSSVSESEKEISPFETINDAIINITDYVIKTSVKTSIKIGVESLVLLPTATALYAVKSPACLILSFLSSGGLFWANTSIYHDGYVRAAPAVPLTAIALYCSGKTFYILAKDNNSVIFKHPNFSFSQSTAWKSYLKTPVARYHGGLVVSTALYSLWINNNISRYFD